MVAVDVPRSVEKTNGTGPPDGAATRSPLAKLVRQRWDDCNTEMLDARRRYWQNLSFFCGEQWVWWDKNRSILQALPQSWSPLASGRARVTINVIEPNVMSVVSRLMASDLEFDVPPTDSGDDVIHAAHLAERILEAEHDTQDWESVRSDELMGAILGGTSAVAVEWDASAGERIEMTADGRVVGTGAARLQSLDITEFGIEPGVRDYRNACWWVMGLAMSPKQAQARYGLSWLPKADASGASSPVQSKVMRTAGKDSSQNLVLVLCLYERPNRDTPKGRYVCVINDTVVSQSKWPFPFERLNIRPFRQKPLPGQWLGWTYMHAAIPVQFAFNQARSVIAEHMKVAGNARLMAPHGAFAEEDFTNDPASILWFSPDGTGSQPNYLAPPQLPRWLIQEASDLKAELDDIMHVHATSRGEASFDRASGQALAVLSEKDDTPLGPMAREQAQGWSELAQMVLRLYESNAQEHRKATVRGEAGVPVNITWTGAAIKGQVEAKVPLEVTRPRSRAAQQAYADSLWDRQIIKDPLQYSRIAMIPEQDAPEVLDADAARAQRENARMMLGEVELVEEFDNHAVHIAEHNRHRKGDGYKFASPQIRELFDQHIQMHETQQAYEYGSQVQKAQTDPGFAALAQGAEPVGSQVPPDYVEAQAGAQPSYGMPQGAQAQQLAQLQQQQAQQQQAQQ